MFKERVSGDGKIQKGQVINFVIETTDLLPLTFSHMKGAFLKLLLTHLGVLIATEQELTPAESTLTLKCGF